VTTEIELLRDALDRAIRQKKHVRRDVLEALYDAIAKNVPPYAHSFRAGETKGEILQLIADEIRTPRFART
jgi:hypothetical protein